MKTAVISKISIGLLMLSAFLSHAQYPDKNVSYIIPFGPGGESDITARYQQPYFKKYFDQDLVISYKPGGGGAVGWAQLNTMPADGYTIMGVNLPHIIIKPLQKDIGFTTADISSVYMFHYTPDAIVVKEDSEFKTLQDLIDYAKANPKKLTFSGSGKGSANHLAQIQFDELAGVETTYVSFKGTGKAVAALLGSQVTAEWGYTSVGAKHEGKVRLLAVATEERHPRFPDVPTFKELGYNMVSGAYRGIALPKDTDESVKQQLSDMIGKINADPEFKAKMENDGMVLVDVSYGQSMDEFMQQKSEDYIKAAKKAGLLK